MSQMDIKKIMGLLIHRYPFLLIDKVIDLQSGKKITALKNVTINEPYFVGHFPGMPVMPGVLILEALAQACGILAYRSASIEEGHDLVILFAGIDNARFKRIVVPGDQLLLEAELIKVKREIWKCNARATVDGELACEAELIGAIRKKGSD